MSMTIVDFREGEGLDLPLAELPEIISQKRKKQAVNSMPEWKIMGADTETIDGKIWLFSTERGVWEIDSFKTLILTLYNRSHASKWKSGRGDGRKSKRGYSTAQFFFWNLKYDVQSILRFWDQETITLLVAGEKVRITEDMPVVGEVEFELKYLEGKFFSIKPIDWFKGQYKVGMCEWWDISQFYNKMRLNNAAKKYLSETKIERCFDGSVLDISRINEPEYRDMYREDIEVYAVQDAVLAGRLTRLERESYIQSGIRFIKPYSLANVAQRNLMDSCQVPTINDFVKSPKGQHVLRAATTSYAGGWFECTGAGFHPDVFATDLASAYPYIIYHLDDCNAGDWVMGDDTEVWWEWMAERSKYQMGFAEVHVVFETGLKWHPLVKKSKTGTLVSPRIVSGWFTAQEIEEAIQWPHTQFIIGEYVIHEIEDNPKNKWARPFIEKFYTMKMESEKGSVEYAKSKVMLNSIYGKFQQQVNNVIGKMWNPMYGSTICGGTRARLAELIRLNDFSAISVATDGVIFPAESFHTVPNRPLPAPYNLGQWEDDGEGEYIAIMSGVYSVRKHDEDFTKTTFRGSASYFLTPYAQGGIFRFCEEHQELTHESVLVNKPYSAKEALIRNDPNLINVFEERRFTIKALGDSTKRLWGRILPRTFGDLLTRWYDSHPHQQVEYALMDATDHVD
jgi:hypothetical protein